MDDREKMLRLYEKMNNIKLKTGELINSIDSFEDDLQKAISINSKTYKLSKVKENKQELKEIKSTIKYNIMNHIREYL
ncbi:MAG: hypothetical protein IKE63_03885 [Bacilli bacterium]|nr:hypothetical protein [Bacilli bacterium]